MAKRTVVLTHNPLYAIDTDAARSGLDSVAQIAEFDLPRKLESTTQLDAVVNALAPASGMLVRIGTLSREIIEHLPNLEVVALHGVGVDQVDVAAATEHGIWVTNVPGGNMPAVVELTVGLMIAMLRRIPFADRNLRTDHDWDGSRYLGHELGSRTVGLVGFGNIAHGVARVCQAFGSEVIATRRSEVNCEIDGISIVPLDEMLSRADIVSLHLPLTDETRGMFSSDQFTRMKPGSAIVNVSRGPIIDQPALEEALTCGRLAGAALDVLQSEPPDWDSPLLEMPNVVLTPHMGGSTHEALAAIAYRAATDIARVMRGERPLHPVNEPR